MGGAAPIVNRWHSPPMTFMAELVRTAEKVATKRYAGRTDAAGGSYVDYTARIVARLGNEREQVVGWLHDVSSNGGMGVGDLLAKGIPSELATSVVALGHRPGEEPSAYYRRVAANPLSLAVKRAALDEDADPQRLDALGEDARREVAAEVAEARQALAAAV
jgi:hypothetical protein